MTGPKVGVGSGIAALAAFLAARSVSQSKWSVHRVGVFKTWTGIACPTGPCSNSMVGECVRGESYVPCTRSQAEPGTYLAWCGLVFFYFFGE